MIRMALIAPWKTDQLWLRLMATLLILLLVMLMGLCCGSAGCDIGFVDHEAIWAIRWPRVLMACATGALLSLSGALLQLLLRNPLADPYTLGVSGGAVVGALVSRFILPFGLIAVSTQMGAMLGALLLSLIHI